MFSKLPPLMDSIYQDEKVRQLYLYDLVIVTCRDRHKLFVSKKYFIEVRTIKWKLFRLKEILKDMKTNSVCIWCES